MIRKSIRRHSSRTRSSRAEQIRAFVEGDLRTAIREDGGEIGFDSFDGKTIHLFMGAGCASCPSQERTARHYVEPLLRKQFGQSLAVKVRVVPPYYSI